MLKIHWLKFKALPFVIQCRSSWISDNLKWWTPVQWFYVTSNIYGKAYDCVACDLDISSLFWTTSLLSVAPSELWGHTNQLPRSIGEWIFDLSFLTHCSHQLKHELFQNFIHGRPTSPLKYSHHFTFISKFCLLFSECYFFSLPLPSSPETLISTVFLTNCKVVTNSFIK